MMAREYKDSGIEWIGKIPKEWKTCQLKRLLTFQNGQDYKHVECDHGYPVYGSGGVFMHASQYLYDGEAVLFGRKGTIDKPLYVNEKFWTVDTMYYAIPIKTGCGKFIYYLGTLLPFNKYQTSTALPSMTQSILGDMNVVNPPLSEQQRIADYLDKKCGEIDELITLQEQMIAQLTDYKQSVITEAVTKGLNPDAELVPSGIDWIGDVPKGWKVMPLKWILKKPLQYGANESGNTFDESLPRYVRITDILNNNLREDLQKQSLTEEQANGYILEDNDILFARSGATVGKAFIYKPKYGRCAFAGYLIRAQINNQNDSNFVYYYTQSSAYEEWKKQIFIQATIQNIGADRYSILDIPIPPLSEQQSITTYLDIKCSEIDSLIAIKQQKIETLKDYKKSVIYEAVTGKMTIGETP